jgi:phosphatidylserine/phosphatidylglycerophosphate/cardiolipin synthase-like enzyme
VAFFYYVPIHHVCQTRVVQAERSNVSKLQTFGVLVSFCVLALLPSAVFAQSPGTRASGTYVCDVAYENCRDDVLTLIQHETVGIDLSFWFMTDARYSNEIVKRWQAGVPVRIIMDPRANTSKPANATQLQQFKNAGIPMLNKPFGDIAHWKGMIFAGQSVAEFSGANYSPYEYVYEEPYVLYEDESIYFSHETDVVHSLMRRFDDVWVDTDYTFYANAITRVRTYPTSYTIAPEFNLPPDDSYTDRLLPLLNGESTGIDVVMFRITDPRPADALINAVNRGVPVRLYAEPLEYRNPARLEDSYNVDRMYMGGVHIKMRAHDGQNHQKTVRLIGQHTTIFGTSNWSTASDDNQLEVNYFTTKDWFYEFFRNQFEWKWNNQPLDGSSAVQTAEFVPLPPDVPSYKSPANAATGVNPASVKLSWYAGSWARTYDIYLGVGPNPAFYKTVTLGPSQSTSDNKSVTVTGLQPGTTYTWKVVSRTFANVAAEGRQWTFTTSGTGTPPPPPPDTTPPSVFVISPANNSTVSGTRDVLASAWDNVAVVGVQFKIDGNNLGAEDRSAPFKVSWDSTNVSSGVHTLTAVARDNAGNRTTSGDITVTVSNEASPPDTTPPTVALTAPGSGSTVSGTTLVSANSSDNVGVTGVQFKLDGANLGGEDTTAPYSVSWNTTSADNGSHSLTAVARDAAGNTTTSAAVAVTVSNTGPPPPPVDTVVLHAADVPAGNIFGNWVKASDGTAADGIALWNADHGAGKIDPALVTPQNYVDITFDAKADTPYHLWVRMRAQNNYFGNDSIHVQFSDAVNRSGTPIYGIGSSGSSNSAEVVLQESDGGAISGWGWADQGWNGMGSDIYFAAAGTHTLRVQQREDGVYFDQIVLVPDLDGNPQAPGAQKNDNTIVPTGPPQPTDTNPPTVGLSAPTDGSTVSGSTTVSADASDDVAVAGVQFKLDGAVLGPEDTTAPYSVSWNTTSVSNGTHTLTAVARDAAGNTTTSTPVSVTVSNTGPPPPQTIVLRAADVPPANIFGNWIRSNDGTASDGIALWNTDNGAAKIAPAQVNPQNYVEITFDAPANTAYHLWIRMKAQNNYYGNDSIHVQFSDSVDNNGAAIDRIGSSGTDNSAQVVLQETDGGSVAGWGWADQGWNGLGANIYFATSGTHTLRIQQREDGVLFDQVVLSPDTYLATPPGPQKNDHTILPR